MHCLPATNDEPERRHPHGVSRRSHDLLLPGKRTASTISFTVALLIADCKEEPFDSFRCIGVSTSPGATALKRMPSFAYSIARFWVAEFKAPFVIMEIEPFTPAIGRSASAAVMLITQPDFCFSISFTVRCVM